MAKAQGEPSAPLEPDLQRYRDLAEQALDLILELDADGVLQYASPRFARLGYRPEQLRGRDVFELVHPDDREPTRAVFRDAVAHGAADEATCRVRTADGDWRWMHVTGQPFRNAEGALRVALVARDVTDRVAAEEALREGERRFRVLVDTASCGILETDAEARITLANRAYAELLGADPRSLRGRCALDFLEDREEAHAAQRALARMTQEPLRPERCVVHLRGPNGRRAAAEVDWNYRRDGEGRVVGFVSVVTDVTRRERTDAALSESHRFITRIAETSPSMLCVFDVREGAIRYVNSRVRLVLGWDAVALGELGARLFQDTVHPDDLGAVRRALAQVLGDRDDVVEAEYRMRHRDGQWRWVQARLAVFSCDDAGEPREVLMALADVTEQRRALDALRAQEERFRLLAENAGDIIMEFDAAGRVLFLSPSWTALTGHPVEPVLEHGLRWVFEHVLPSDEIDAFRAAFSILDDEPATPARLYRLRHASGEWRWFEARSSLFTTADGERRGISIGRDVTDRVRAEEALRSSEARFRVVAESLYDFVVELTADGEVAYLSPSFYGILGFDPARFGGADAARLIHPDDLDAVAAAVQKLLAGEPLGPLRFRMQNASGDHRWLETQGTPRPTADGRHAGVLITRDVTEALRAEEEARTLQEQLLQAQKLESLGVLAGGIAHDFNNLLVGILGNASLALAEVSGDSPLRETLQGIETAALRAGELTNQMLAYSGKGRFVVEPLDLNALVREMAHLLEASISKKASLRLDLGVGLPSVEGDPAQLRQLVMNLITNASDALGGQPGVVEVATRRVDDPAALGMPSLVRDAAQAPCVVLEVTDTGCGMDPDTRKRIFDPFFTTKFTGRGLGLAAALGIVRGHRGAIDVESEPGRGTRFRILLPGSRERAAEREGPERPEVPAAAVGGTVLVADDEEVVRRMARVILEKAGFEVLLAADGREAVDTFRAHRGRIAAVLLDLTMPHLGGEEALRAIREADPDVPVVLTSGYAESEIALRFEGVPLDGFLQKPFRPTQLVERIRAALDGA